MFTQFTFKSKQQSGINYGQKIRFSVYHFFDPGSRIYANEKDEKSRLTMTTEKLLERAKESAWLAFMIYSLIRIWGDSFKDYSYYFAYYFLIVRLSIAFIIWFRSVKADG